MRKVFKGMSVDAGMLCIADVGYLKQHGATLEKYGDRYNIRRIINLPIGKYKITYKVRDCWVGSPEDTVEINCQSGQLLVGDPCYNFPNIVKGKDVWVEFLHEIDYGNNCNKFIHTINTGGDGGFDIRLEIVPIKE